MNLTAVVLTFNEAQNIVPCLQSLSWADRLVVFDGGPESPSRDGTPELARSAGADVLHHRFEDYAQQRNAAIDRIAADWIFFVDADERATPALAEEVCQVIRDRTEVGWSVPRHNYIFGRLTLGGGWYPDYQFRLFRRGHARWERPVHEIAVVDGPQGHLKHPLVHYNYEDLSDFIVRQDRYNTFDAGIMYERSIRPHLHTPFAQAARQFWWRFVTLRGARDGLHGLRLSLLMAYYEMRKYRLLAELWRR